MFFYYLSFLFLLASSLLLFYKFLFLLAKNITIIYIWEIVTLNNVNIEMLILFDWMSMSFMSFVLLISAMVVYYSNSYMSNDKCIIRFLILVLLFVFSMMVMIISPNLISILLGWDGLGLVSYCLVIYFQNIKSFNAGMLTVLSNRIGDVMLLISISLMLSVGSWNFINFMEYFKNDFKLQMIGCLILLGGMTKSAQIPFSSWLPAAMAAPTPVSALVHSSTLVTAGVYLMIRFNELFMFSWLNTMLVFIGTVTMFMAGLGATFEMDLKKIIAFSTLSQLGLMMGIIGLNFFKLGFFHLLTHALFKALLFLCAGAFIHNLLNFQDIRLSGNFWNQMPLTSLCFNISSLALCGMPFLAGFYSKDMILEFLMISKVNLILFVLFFLSTLLTVIYSFRLIFNLSIMSFSMFSLISLSDENWTMIFPMIIMTLFSLLGGSMLGWLIFPLNILILIPIYMKLLTIFICSLGMILGYIIFSMQSIYFIFLNSMYTYINMFLSNMWMMPIMVTQNLIKFPLLNSIQYYKNMDMGWSEICGANSLLNMLIFSSKFWSSQFNFNSLKYIFMSYLIILFLVFMLFM